MLERGEERGELLGISSQMGRGGVQDMAEDEMVLLDPYNMTVRNRVNCRATVLGVGERRSSRVVVVLDVGKERRSWLGFYQLSLVRLATG